VDLVGALLWRVVRPVNRPLMARLLWERERRTGDLELELVDRLVRRDAVVLDVGANFGQFTWRMAHLVGPGGYVHAFEPHPAHREELAGIATKRPNVTFHPVALSDRPGEAGLTVPRVDGEAKLALATLAPRAAGPDELEQVPVAVETLDRALAGRDRPVTFIKCDVEGHERAFLDGAREVLRDDQPTLLVEIEQRHQGRDVTETLALLDDLGYDGYALFGSALRPVAEFDVERDQLAYVRAEPGAAGMPAGYVNDFLFVSRARPIALPVPVAAAAPA